MSFLTRAFFWGYVATLFLAGVGGALLPAHELSLLFGLEPGDLEPQGNHSLLNQYRFLKTMEVGFGLYCVAFRREIFTLRPFNRLFLAILGLGAGARLTSVIVDGWPHWTFAAFAVLEMATGCLVYIRTRGRLADA